MIRLLKVTYEESADSISQKINLYVNNQLDVDDYPPHTELGEVLSAAAEMKEYSWEPYTQDCIYIITCDTMWKTFETLLLQKVGVKYVVEDVLDRYYNGEIKLPRLRKKIEKYLRFWLTSDEVLDKIGKHGMDSLTATDYQVLKAASAKSTDI
jgi:hypothetical protein